MTIWRSNPTKQNTQAISTITDSRDVSFFTKHSLLVIHDVLPNLFLFCFYVLLAVVGNVPSIKKSKANEYKSDVRQDGAMLHTRPSLQVIEELNTTGKFEFMDHSVDEAEHSMEMHLPYLSKVFQGHNVKVVPILVGALNSQNEAMYGQLLSKYLDDPKNFFSISSDFCHWGTRFSYTYYDKSHGAIHKSIEALDRMGMEIIETGNPNAFKQYLQEYENTICGRHPISVFLNMLQHCSSKVKIGFVRYEQSSQCKSMRDSSVSYASAAAKLDTPAEEDEQD
ncbi:protein MEMO1 isoform X2 [Oryza brachyantha]|uniref:protein MEMO1 isoform X2 n=1 Tax=Oryza brachyantha TaxID=4533 RepID=UPI0003EAC467|nr:protein MEMO1 isoform X2 [Oryza brachyantha]